MDQRLALPPLVIYNYSDKPQKNNKPSAMTMRKSSLKSCPLAEKSRPQDLYDIVYLYQEYQRLNEKAKFVDALKQKCSYLD